eukprot:3500716-Amphidinium_carterae.2
MAWLGQGQSAKTKKKKSVAAEDPDLTSRCCWIHVRLHCRCALGLCFHGAMPCKQLSCTLPRPEGHHVHKLGALSPRWLKRMEVTQDDVDRAQRCQQRNGQGHATKEWLQHRRYRLT